ncbi:Methionyl-tRNA formyltransferase [Grifola frondosa]|uniref:methionyl-tRNA formyltransferase n=1 Tax=Grifola frondosa TaxID=5627 RepID=A0A1C7LRF3_GRIFR|nr:Methionyl-tRNA formyltransferase [Grifola frondosa]
MIALDAFKRSACRRFYQTTSSDHTPFRVLFFGRDEFSCVVLEQLHAAKDVWSDIHIVTNPDVKTGRRGSQLSISPLKILGQQLDLTVHTIPHEKTSFKNWQPPESFYTSETLQQPSSQYLLVTASFGRILPNSLLNIFAPPRRLNVHPSLLPAYRGAAPIQYALLDGREETGVCVIGMTERKKGIDSGDIWGCTKLKIPEGSMFTTLRESLALEGGKLLVSVLRDMLAGKAKSTPQVTDPSAPRAPLITAEDSLIDFPTMTAEHIVRRYRAISHQKPIVALLKTKRTLQLHSPSVLAERSTDTLELIPRPGLAVYHLPKSSLLIRCAADTVLSVPQVKQQDRALLKAKEWWNGVRPEMRMSEEGPVQFLSWDALDASN